MNRNLVEWVIVVASALALIAFASWGRSTIYSHFVQLDLAWMRGGWTTDYGEAPAAADYHVGNAGYVVEPPFPGLLTLPLVLLFGGRANQTFVAEILGAVCVGLTWYLLLLNNVARPQRLWICAFTLFGTDILWCSELGDVWGLSQLSAFALTMWILIELCLKRRGWLVAILSVLSMESRAATALAIPLYVRLSKKRAQMIPWFIAGAAVFVACNMATWGTWYNAGYPVFFHQDPWGQKEGSPFSVAYVPYELYSYFLRPPDLVAYLNRAAWPIFNIHYMGLALTWTSPALLIAVLVKSKEALPLWITSGLLFLPSLFYYSDGWNQAGMRHALDFEPFLITLMAAAAREGLPRWAYLTMGWSIAVGAWTVWWWNSFIRFGGN